MDALKIKFNSLIGPDKVVEIVEAKPPGPTLKRVTHAHAHTLNTKQHLYGNTCASLAPRGRPGSVCGCARRHTLPRAPARLARETARVATERLPLPELHGVIDYKLRFVPDVGIDATHEDVQQPIARHAHLRPR